MKTKNSINTLHNGALAVNKNTQEAVDYAAHAGEQGDDWERSVFPYLKKQYKVLRYTPEETDCYRAWKKGQTERAYLVSSGKVVDINTARSAPGSSGRIALRREGGNALDVEVILDAMGKELRYNLRKSTPEIADKGNNNWEPIINNEIPRLYKQIQKEYTWGRMNNETGEPEDTGPLKIARDNFKDGITAIAADNKIDPFRAWLETLDPWDGEARLETMLLNCFTLEGCWTWAAWCGKSIVLGAVERTYNPGCQKDEMVVLSGPEGIGKSTFFKNLLPPGDNGFFSDALKLSDDPGRQIEALSCAVIVEVAELAGISRAELDRLKSFITTREDMRRLAYRTDPERFKRVCVLVGTTNLDDPLPNDPHGNRRFALCKVTGGCGEGRTANLRSVKRVREYMDENRGQLWAEALFRFNAGEKSMLPNELIPMQVEINEQARGGRDHYVEDKIAACLEYIDENKPMSAEIYKYMGYEHSPTRAIQKAISKELDRLGYERVTVRDTDDPNKHYKGWVKIR